MVDVVHLAGVALQREVGERGLQTQRLDERHVRALLDERRDAVVEQLERGDLRRHVLPRGGEVVGQAIHHQLEDGAHVDLLLQRRARLQEDLQRAQVEVVGEDLDDALHQIRLRDRVLAGEDLLDDLGQDAILVLGQVEALQLRQTHQIRAHQDAQIHALLLTALAILCRTLMLQANPETVRLGEVLQQERDGVVDVAADALVRRAHVGQAVLRHLREVVSQEETAHGVLDALDHLDEVLENILRRRLLRRDVHATDAAQQIQTRDDRGTALNTLINLHHGAARALQRLQILFEFAQFVHDLHVQLVVVLGSQQARAQLAQHFCGVIQSQLQIVGIHGTLHVKGLVLHHLEGFLQVFDLLFFHFCDRDGADKRRKLLPTRTTSGVNQFRATTCAKDSDLLGFSFFFSSMATAQTRRAASCEQAASWIFCPALRPAQFVQILGSRCRHCSAVSCERRTQGSGRRTEAASPRRRPPLSSSQPSASTS